MQPSTEYQPFVMPDLLRLVKSVVAIDGKLIERDPFLQGPADFWVGVEKARRAFLKDSMMPLVLRIRMLSIPQSSPIGTVLKDIEHSVGFWCNVDKGAGV